MTEGTIKREKKGPIKARCTSIGREARLVRIKIFAEVLYDLPARWEGDSEACIHSCGSLRRDVQMVSQSTHLKLTECIARRVYAPERPTRPKDLDRLIES